MGLFQNNKIDVTLLSKEEAKKIGLPGRINIKIGETATEERAVDYFVDLTNEAGKKMYVLGGRWLYDENDDTHVGRKDGYLALYDGKLEQQHVLSMGRDFCMDTKDNSPEEAAKYLKEQKKHISEKGVSGSLAEIYELTLQAIDDSMKEERKAKFENKKRTETAKENKLNSLVNRFVMGRGSNIYRYHTLISAD